MNILSTTRGLSSRHGQGFMNEIDGSEELLQVAFDAGLGSKNSQGFGMIEKYEKLGNYKN